MHFFLMCQIYAIKYILNKILYIYTLTFQALFNQSFVFMNVWILTLIRKSLYSSKIYIDFLPRGSEPLATGGKPK